MLLAVSLAKPLAFYGAAGAADYVTTQQAVARGGVERNVMGPKAGPVATAAAFLVVDLALQRRGSRTAVRALRTVGVGFMVGCAIHNARWR